MQISTPFSTDQLFEGLNPREPTLVVLNRRAPRQLTDVLHALFARQPVRVVERRMTNAPDDLVELVEDGVIQAVSPLDELADAVLLVNSDRYHSDEHMGGLKQFPDVLAYSMRFSSR